MTQRWTAFAAALLCAAVAGQGVRGSQASAHSREAYVMGTRVALTTYADTREAGLARLERMLEVIEQTERQLSTWREDSEISRLNASAGTTPQPLTPPTCRLLTDLAMHVAATEAAFDPAIGALTDAWDLHGRGRVPSAPELAAARARSGWRRVRLDTERCTLALPEGASIDVGAFGKGEALDRVRAALGEERPWLIDLGGHVAVSGVPPAGGGWQVSIANPHDRHRAAIRVTMDGGSLSTSGGSERDLTINGIRVGHILDPRTGAPAGFVGGVSVWSKSALEADVLSTALYVMGPEAGLRWADAHEVAALFLSSPPPTRTRASKAWVYELFE